jgi:DNA-binding transcriptional MerR regulator
MSEFSTFQLAKILKTNRSVIQLWLTRNLIKPSINAAEGNGSKNIFDKNDIYRVYLFKLLFESGLSQTEASRIANKIDVEKFAERNKYIVLQRINLNGKLKTTVLITKSLSADNFFSEENIAIMTVLDGQKIKKFIDGLI